MSRSFPTGAPRAILKNLGWLLASRGTLAVLSLVYLAIATRTLGIGNFGRFALITGASQALATLVGFQTWQVVVRFGVDYVQHDDEAGLARLMRLCLLLDAGSAIAGALLAFLILHFGAEAMQVSADLAPATLAYAVVQLVTIRSTALGILRLRDRFAYAAAADTVLPLVRLVGAGAAALFMPTVIGFLLAWAAAEIATSIAYWAILARTGELGRIWRSGGIRGRAPDGLLHFMLTTNAASTLGLSTKQLPLLIVGGTGGVAAAGAFRLALQIAQGLTKVGQLVSRAAFPEIMRLVRTADAERVARTAVRGLGAASLGGLVVLLVIALSGHWLLHAIGGHGFKRGYAALIWLAAAGCIDLAVVGFEPILLGAGRSGSALAIRGLAVALQIAVTVTLLPLLHATAAAIGVFVASASAALLLVGAVVNLPRIARRAAIAP